jgi:hypothetical protein
VVDLRLLERALALLELLVFRLVLVFFFAIAQMFLLRIITRKNSSGRRS